LAKIVNIIKNLDVWLVKLLGTWPLQVVTENWGKDHFK
jgi:hypothetical protein